MMIRTFIALEIPHHALEVLQKTREDSIHPKGNVRWESVDKLHITLKFLGNTDEKIVDQLIDDIDLVAKKYKKFHLSFHKFGEFKRDNEPKILWAGIHENIELVKIAKEIDDITARYGYEKERREFKPHITLLRFRGHEDKEEILRLIQIQFPRIDFIADNLVLMKSELKPTGSVYTPIKNFQINN